MTKHVEEALNMFTRNETFEDRVLELAAERAKAEVQRAPDLMSEAAGRIARNEADALFKTKLQSQDFNEQVRQIVHDQAGEVLRQLSTITPEDVEVISRRIAEEMLGPLADSDQLTEKIAESVADRPTKAEVTDEIAKLRMDLMASQDFGEWIKDGVKSILDELGLGEGVEGLEKSLVSPEKVEKIARHEALTAAMDLLETKEFTRRIVALLEDDPVKTKVEEISGGAVSPDQLEQTADLQARNVFAEQIETPEFAEKVKSVMGGDDAKDLSKRLIERMDRIEKEALPAIVERLLEEKMGAVSGDAIAEKVGGMVQEAVAAKVDPAAMQQQIVDIAQENIKDIANTPGFKAMLDEKFKVVLNYLTKDVIPKQIKKIMGG
jgi:hypothetical protein